MSLFLTARNPPEEDGNAEIREGREMRVKKRIVMLTFFVNLIVLVLSWGISCLYDDGPIGTNANLDMWQKS